MNSDSYLNFEFSILVKIHIYIYYFVKTVEKEFISRETWFRLDFFSSFFGFLEKSSYLIDVEFIIKNRTSSL